MAIVIDPIEPPAALLREDNHDSDTQIPQNYGKFITIAVRSL